jgi:hypothetical protein
MILSEEKYKNIKFINDNLNELKIKIHNYEFTIISDYQYYCYVYTTNNYDTNNLNQKILYENAYKKLDKILKVIDNFDYNNVNESENVEYPDTYNFYK